MKILFITHTYPPSIGGMQKQSYELIKGFSRRVKVCKLVYDSSRESKIVFFLLLRRRVRRLLKEHPDISLIHLNDGLMALVGLCIRSLTDLPIVVTIHGLDIAHPSKIFQLYIVSRFRKSYQAFIAVSRFSRDECIKQGLSNVYVVNNGVDGSIANIPRDDNFRTILKDKLGIELGARKFIVSIGRPVPRKGFTWFLRDVFPDLPSDIVYIIVGPRARHIKLIYFLLACLPKKLARDISLLFGFALDEPVIERLLESEAMRDRVFYTGSLEFSYIVQLLKSASLFIMPNRKTYGDVEGFGLVALEASLAGTVVLCSGIDGITDAIIDGENGLYVRYRDKEAWITMIKDLLKRDDDYLRVFGERSCAYTLEHYSWDKMVDGYYSIFKSMV